MGFAMVPCMVYLLERHSWFGTKTMVVHERTENIRFLIEGRMVMGKWVVEEKAV